MFRTAVLALALSLATAPVASEAIAQSSYTSSGYPTTSTSSSTAGTRALIKIVAFLVVGVGGAIARSASGGGQKPQD